MSKFEHFNDLTIELKCQKKHIKDSAVLDKYLNVENNITTEAINPQGKSKLFEGLSEELKHLKNDINKNKKQVAKRMSAINVLVKKTTGINLILGISESTQINAYVFPPKIDKNNPLININNRPFYNNSDFKKVVTSSSGVLNGQVDRKKSMVSGDFSKIPIKAFLTAGLIKNIKPGFSEKELAAILIHEIGHVFTYFEYLGTYITTNFVLQHTTREIFKTNETTRRYEILEETEQLLKMEIEDKDQLTSVDKKTVLQTVILSNKVKQVENELKSKSYDHTAYEMLSDQFAARHGSGRALATGLTKLNKHSTSLMSDEQFSIYLTELYIGYGLFTVFTFGAFAFVTVLVSLLFDFSKETYDKPGDRLRRIRNDLVSQIKESNDPDIKKELISQKESLDLMLGKYKDRLTFEERLNMLLRPDIKKQHNQKLLQKELEDLVTNDLFVQSEKFKLS